MIIKGRGRTNGSDLGAYLGDYLQHEKNEKVAVLQIRGSAFSDLGRSLASWEAEAQGTRCKNALWHAQMRTPHGESLTREQQLEAVNILERHLGFQDQPRAVVIHTKDCHEHIHVAWSRIDRKTGKARRDDFTHKKNVAAAREIELRFGLQYVDSPSFEKDGTRRDRREASRKAPDRADYAKAKRSKLDPQQRRETITKLWHECDSGKALQAALLDAGYVLARGDRRSFVVVDKAGDVHSLARQIRIKDVLKAQVDARLSDLDPASVPKAEHIRQQIYFARKEQEKQHPPAPDRTRSKGSAPAPPCRNEADDAVGKESTRIHPLDPVAILAAITQQRSTFTKGELEYETSKRVEKVEGATNPARIAALAHATLHQEDCITLGQDRVGHIRYTSRGMLDTELAMRDSSDVLAGIMRHGVWHKIRDAAPSAEKLGDEQRQAFEHVTSAPALSIVIGYAGTGKSTMLGAAREAWEAAGYRVRGVALSGMAAQSLQEGSGIESRTLASLFGLLGKLPEQQARLDAMDEKIAGMTGKSFEERKRRADEKTRRDLFEGRMNAVRFTARDVIVLDEAAMVGSRQMNDLLSAADKAKAKIVLVGDAEQLQAIDAGGAFRALADRHGAVKISEIRRQKDEWAKAATRDFGDGFTREALGSYREQKHVHEMASQEDARGRIIADWTASRNTNLHDTHLMLAFTRDDVALLNERARQVYKDEGRLGLDNFVKTDTGIKEFARGDRIYFLQNDTRLKVKNGSLGTIQHIEENTLRAYHRITVTLDNDETVQFNTADYDKFSHGYAATIHKSQGVTANRSHLLASRYMDRHAAYVAMTRHIDQADMYYSTHEFATYDKLATALSRDRRKDTTLDYLYRAEKAGKSETFWKRVNKVVEIVTKDDKRKKAFERLAEAIRLRTDPAAKAERERMQRAAVSATKLRDVLGERPDNKKKRDRAAGVSM